METASAVIPSEQKAPRRDGPVSSGLAAAVPPSSNQHPSLADFLVQIRAGSSPASHLPFEAQRDLIRAQRGSLSSRLRQEALDNQDEMQRAITASHSNEARLQELEQQIRTFQHDEAKLVPHDLASLLNDFRKAAQKEREASLLLDAAKAVYRAVQGVEEFEANVAAGQLEKQAYGQALEALESSVRPIGLASEPSEQDPSWLTQGRNAPPEAMRDLTRRIDQAKKQAICMLDEAWNAAIRSRQDRAADQATAQVSVASGIVIPQSAGAVITVEALMQSLESRGLLESKLRDLAINVVDLLASSCLASSRSEHTAWTCTAQSEGSGAQSNRTITLHATISSGPNQGDPGSRYRDATSCFALGQALQHLDEFLVKLLPSSIAKKHFSQNLLSRLTPHILRSLNAALPEYGSEDLAMVGPRLAEVQTSARELYAVLLSTSLVEGPTLQAGSPEDEALGSPSQIATFAEEVAERVAVQWTNGLLDQTRALCGNRNADQAWDAEEIQIGPAILLPDRGAHEMGGGLVQHSSPPAGQSQWAADTSISERGGNGWAWDEDDAEIAESTSQSDVEKTQKNEAASSNAPQFNGFGTKEGHTSKKKTNAKSTLGGVRVLRPQDQLGSGPFPDDDSETGWEFEDEFDEGLKDPMTTQQPSAMHTDPQKSPSTMNTTEEEDAWFMEEEDQDDRTRETSLAAVQPSEEAARPNPRSDGNEINRSVMMPADLSAEEIDIDEDAWGLSEAEKAKRASMMLPGVNERGSLVSEWQAKLRQMGIAESSEEARSGIEDNLQSYDAVPDAGSQAAASVPSSSHTATKHFDALPLEESGDGNLDDDAWGLSEEPEAHWAGLTHSEARATSSVAMPLDATDTAQHGPILSAKDRSKTSGSELPLTDVPQDGAEKGSDLASAPSEAPSQPQRTNSDAADVTAPSSAVHGEVNSPLDPIEAESAPLQLTQERMQSLDEDSQAPEHSVASSVAVAAPRSPPPAPRAGGGELSRRSSRSTLSAAVDVNDFASISGSSEASGSARRPFPIESALPEGVASSESLSLASFTAAPKSLVGGAEKDADTISEGGQSLGRLGTDSFAGSDLDDTDARVQFPIESALPPGVSREASDSDQPENVVAQDSVASGSVGPPSVASLPPTPKAERTLDFGRSSPVARMATDTTNLLQDSTPPLSRPYTPVIGDGSSDVPFPVHSAMPWTGSESLSGARRGPPSVVSVSAGSDVALPPSPLPERALTPLSVTAQVGRLDLDSHARTNTASEDQSDRVANEPERALFEAMTPGAMPPTSLGDRHPPSDKVSSLGDSTAASLSTDGLQSATPPTSGEEAEDTSVAATLGSSRSDAASIGDATLDDDPWAELEQEAPTERDAVSGDTPEVGSRPAGPVLGDDRDEVTTDDSVESEGLSQQALPVTSADDDWDWDKDNEGAPAKEASPNTAITAGSDSAMPTQQQSLLPLAQGLPPVQLGQSKERRTARDEVTAVSRQANLDNSSISPTDRTLPSENQTGKAFEICRISKRSRELVQLANRTLDDCLSLAQRQRNPESTDKGLLPGAGALLQTLPKVFEIHRALMPTLHHDTVTQVPSLAMQFANDCRFLAGEIGLISERLSSPDADGLATPGIVKATRDALAREGRLTTLLGKRTFDGQLAAQAQVLAERLQEADSLLQVYRDDRFATCQRCFEQILSIFEGLDRAWGGQAAVLGKSARLAALGTLLEATLRGLWANVIDMDDIGEQEGQRLAQLFQLLSGSSSNSLSAPIAEEDASRQPHGRLETLFLDVPDGREDVSQAAPRSLMTFFVPSWIKVTGYLPEILLGSLADVEFLLFDAGALVPRDVFDPSLGSTTVPPLYIGPDEAKRLIRATFADTKRRSDLLARVDRRQ
ncbi:unnamed protein product [Parajaminaea phylloscopi]